MAKKPSNLIYGVDEHPGWGALFLLGLQHISILTIAFIFPVVIVDAVGGTTEDAKTLITMAMIATGIGTILQGLNRGPVGSGYLCPLVNGPAFLSASLLAGKAGGLPLIFGMTVVGSLFEGAFSRIVARLRAVFPAEVTGTIVMMVGIEIIPLAATRFLGFDRGHREPDTVSFFVALITFAAMAGFNVWGKGKLRLYSVLLGMIVGYAASIAAGVLTVERLQQLLATPFFSFPSFGKYGLSFDWALLVPFLVATLSSALKTMGDLTTCQKINDAEWKRPEMQSISRGILACALGNLISGLTGSLGQSVSSSNVGLSIATGATSRRIAYSAGGILVLLAFFPKLAGIFAIMPTPVMGASLVFAACFMILAGMQIVLSRMMDARKTFVIGISIIFGLSVDIVPGLYRQVPVAILPLVGSSLSLATICAIVLNLFFRIGVKKTARLELTPETHSADQVFEFMEKQGSLWGALRDVVYRAASVVNECRETLSEYRLARGPIQVEVRFDEFNLDVELAYEGTAMSFPEVRPGKRELVQDEDAVARLSGFLIRSQVDRVRTAEKDGRCRIQLHFDH